MFPCRDNRRLVTRTSVLHRVRPHFIFHFINGMDGGCYMRDLLLPPKCVDFSQINMKKRNNLAPRRIDFPPLPTSHPWRRNQRRNSRVHHARFAHNYLSSIIERSHGDSEILRPIHRNYMKTVFLPNKLVLPWKSYQQELFRPRPTLSRTNKVLEAIRKLVFVSNIASSTQTFVQA